MHVSRCSARTVKSASQPCVMQPAKHVFGPSRWSHMSCSETIIRSAGMRAPQQTLCEATSHHDPCEKPLPNAPNPLHRPSGCTGGVDCVVVMCGGGVVVDAERCFVTWEHEYAPVPVEDKAALLGTLGRHSGDGPWRHWGAVDDLGSYKQMLLTVSLVLCLHGILSTEGIVHHQSISVGPIVRSTAHRLQIKQSRAKSARLRGAIAS